LRTGVLTAKMHVAAADVYGSSNTPVSVYPLVLAYTSVTAGPSGNAYAALR